MSELNDRPNGEPVIGPNERAAIERARVEQQTPQEPEKKTRPLFMSEFKAKHGISFRADPPDSLHFDYDGDEVVIRVSGQQGDGGDGAGPTNPETPIDEEQESDKPFAIKVKITSKAIADRDWATAQVSVLSGTYKDYVGVNGTFSANNVEFPDFAYDQSITKANYAGFVYLIIPVETATESTGVKSASGSYIRAKTGGVIALSKIERPAWPHGFNSAVYGYCTYIQIGTWGIKAYNKSPGGIPTWELRLHINQVTSDNVVIGSPDEEGELVTADNSRTFFVTAGTGASVNITPGAINSAVCSTTSLAVSDGQSIYIDETVNGAGVTTAVVCAAGGSVPTPTTTHGYQLLATVAVAAGVVTVTPLGWDFSNARVCGTPGVSTQHDFW